MDESEASLAARQALGSDRESLELFRTLGLRLHGEGKYRDAELVFLRMTEFAPTSAMLWMNVGTAQRCDGRVDEALYAYAKSAALGASSGDFYYNVALAHLARADHEAACHFLRKAAGLCPKDAEICYRYALSCYDTFRFDEASTALVDWELIPDAVASEHATSAGQLLMMLGHIERAEPLIRSAAGSETNLEAKLAWVQLLERTNRVAEARRELDTLTANPEAGDLGDDLIATDAQIAQRESDHERSVSMLRELGDKCPHIHLKHFWLFPLAKSLDALGHYEAAFAALEGAHASQAAYFDLTFPIAAANGTPPLVITRQSCDAADVATWPQYLAPAAAESPIFIVGFPRSGTTLLELALDAHPHLQSMDEQPFLKNALDDICEEGIEYPGKMGALTQPQLDRIRERYWSRVDRRIERGSSKRLIDKNPLNILRLPVIKRLFPNAKILLAVRHPCDAILSCFMQLFRAPDFALLCRDLPTLVTAYRKIFDFWYAQQALLHADTYELVYEKLVEDFSGGMARVLDFLDLPWDSVVLEPWQHARHKRYISTPSYSQVIRPINSRSVGRWRHYRSHFESNLAVLRPYLHRWDYFV